MRRTLFLLVAAIGLAATATAQRVQTDTFAVLFAHNVHELTATAQAQLAEIAAQANTAHYFQLELAGHTDRSGDERLNERLAAKRVDAVQTALLGMGLTPDQLSTASFGESRPALAEDTPDAYTLNRRVELVLTTHRITNVDELREVLGKRYSTTQTFNNSFGGEMMGREGTILTLPQNLFVRADGTELPTDAQVDVNLEEATRLSSMVAHGVNTNGHSGKLQTGGMVRVTGLYEGQELRLRDGSAIGVSMPTVAPNDQMRLYTGERGDDGAMDWQLEPGETTEASTRLTLNKAQNVLLGLSADSLAMMTTLLKRRNAILPQLTFRQHNPHVTVSPAMVLRDLPAAYDPMLGIPKQPFVPAPPQREDVTRGEFLRSKANLQAAADQQFEIDSLTYAAEIPAHEAKIARWEQQVEEFHAAEPERRAAYEEARQLIIAHRVQQAKAHIVEVSLKRIMRAMELWRAEMFARGPAAAESIDSCRSPLVHPLADKPLVHSILIEAFAGEASSARLAEESADYKYDVLQAHLLDSLGMTAAFEEVSALQHRLCNYLKTARRMREEQMARQAEALNRRLMATYDFEIRVSQPAWHNCDQPMPYGDYQMQVVDRGVPAAVYFASAKQRTVNYYPPSGPAAAIYQEQTPVEVIAFAVNEKGMQLAHQFATPSKRVRPDVDLRFAPATLAQVEAAIASLDEQTF